MNRPRLILSGLSGGAGKTILTLGLCRAWRRKGRCIQPFKKGPDYIDAAWLGLAARAPASNLDPFLMSEDILKSLFLHASANADLSLIEGNRGIFDGMDLLGSCSTAVVARMLDAPVVLILDCTKMTRTAAAIVAGCMAFEPECHIAGVILNRTAGERHRNILRQCIEHYAGIPVLGTLPKLASNPIPERHMGLVSNREFEGQETILESLADIAADFLDLDSLWEIGQSAPPFPDSGALRPLWPQLGALRRPLARIGYVRDAALWFYYEENLEALRQAGAELVELSLLTAEPWPDIHGLYLGGGFPETQARELAANRVVRQRVRTCAELGMPIYAECGGFMYLAESLVWQGEKLPMAGVFPVRTEVCEKPQGLGYVEAEVVHENPFFECGARVRGHEFHYSRCFAADEAVLSLGLKLAKGEGILAHYDGLIYKNTFATYMHTHALGFPDWARNFVSAAGRFREEAAG